MGLQIQLLIQQAVCLIPIGYACSLCSLGLQLPEMKTSESINWWETFSASFKTKRAALGPWPQAVSLIPDPAYGGHLFLLTHRVQFLSTTSCFKTLSPARSAKVPIIILHLWPISVPKKCLNLYVSQLCLFYLFFPSLF